MEKNNKLYKVTNEIGEWWVVATHPTEAEEKLVDLLNTVGCADYSQRIPTKIELIATQYIDKTFLVNHRLVV